MKKVEEIEKEYQNFKTNKPFIKNLMEFICYIEIGLDNLVEDQDELAKERRNIKLDMFMLKLTDFITLKPIEEDRDVSFLAEDINILNRIINLGNKQAEYFAKIAELATESNFGELLRLLDFSCEYYNKNIDYLDYLRDKNEFRIKGIVYQGTYNDFIQSFDTFMQKKLQEFEKQPEKAVEKRKNK